VFWSCGFTVGVTYTEVNAFSGILGLEIFNFSEVGFVAFLSGQVLGFMAALP
jgi:hypothetical protein